MNQRAAPDRWVRMVSVYSSYSAPRRRVACGYEAVPGGCAEVHWPARVRA